MMSKSGFTLIELMVVVIIIVALAGMVLPHLMNRPDEMKSGIAQGDIQGIVTGLEMYKLDNGRFPSSDEGLGSLVKRPASAKSWKGPYVKKKNVTDPWKNNYQYKNPGTRSLTGPDVWSIGPDGQGGNEDDVWPEE